MIRATPPGGSRGSIGVVFVLVVLVAFPDPEPPDPEPPDPERTDPEPDADFDADKDADDVMVVAPDCEREVEPLADGDWLADVLEALSLSAVVEASLFWFCRRTSKASILLCKESGHGQAEEITVKKRRRAAKIGTRPEPFMLDARAFRVYATQTIGSMQARPCLLE